MYSGSECPIATQMMEIEGQGVLDDEHEGGVQADKNRAEDDGNMINSTGRER